MNWYEDFAQIVRTDVPLAPYTWYGLGGPARYFVEPRNIDELRAVVKRLRDAQIPIYVLGHGANLLVRDEGVSGAVFHLMKSPAFCDMTVNGGIVTAGAGKDVQQVVRETAHAGLQGLECLAGIPGSVGGEIRMNAGGSFGDIGSSVKSVKVMDINGEIDDLARDEIVFEYRHSNIAAKFILEATFELAEDDPTRVVNKMKEIWMFKKNSQPLADKSAGCAFKNPKGDSAGRLIDQAGLKGLSVGGAEVSPKHGNFIVAHEGAKSADILALIAQIQEKVNVKFGVELKTEIAIW